jgi:hypothetical protein
MDIMTKAIIQKEQKTVKTIETQFSITIALVCALALTSITLRRFATSPKEPKCVVLAEVTAPH